MWGNYLYKHCRNTFSSDVLLTFRTNVAAFVGIIIRHSLCNIGMNTQISRFMGPTWDPPGSCRRWMGPMFAPWTLISGLLLQIMFLETTKYRNADSIGEFQGLFSRSSVRIQEHPTQRKKLKGHQVNVTASQTTDHLIVCSQAVPVNTITTS